MQPYSGIRALDLTWHYGSYPGRLFADLGAEVIRVEPPGGLPDRHEMQGRQGDFSARFAFLNASKMSVELDTGDERGRQQFERLARIAQIAFVEGDGALFDRVAQLRQLNPTAVITAVSPFGMTGPLADTPASDLTLQAAGGIAWMSGRLADAPLSLPFDQATMVAGIYAATLTAIALFDAEQNGTGHLLDVSVQEAIAHSLQNALQVWDLEGIVSVRGGEGTRDASEDIFSCRDGLIFLASPLSLGNSWKNLVAWVNEVGHASGPALCEASWSDREWRMTGESRRRFRDLFTAFAMERTKEELVSGALVRRVVLSPVNRIPDLFDDPQLAHRAFFTEVAAGPQGRAIAFPGAPYRLSPAVWKVAPPPKLGEHNEILSRT